MGGGRWDASAWGSYASVNVSSKATVDGIYNSRSLKKELDPLDITIRESCDSPDNPNSTAIIIGLDVTGSMGCVLDAMARTGLNTVATEVYNRKPVTDPHLMFMGIGDADCDDAPLQVTQFEADIRIAEQLTKIYLERGGGGNDHESYILPWYFAANYTKIDCFEKRGKKGVLFTIGDECPPAKLTSRQVEKVFGQKPQFESISAVDLLTMVSRQYDVFHLMVEEGDYYRGHGNRVRNEWTNLLGERAIRLSDHTKMGEVIISILQTLAGEDVDKVVSSWDGSTGLVVKNAISGLTGINNSGSGVVTFD